MRTLQNTDIFAFGRILSKANLKDEIKKISVGNEKDVEAIGFDLLFTILTSCSDKAVEEEIFSFLASIFEMEVEEVKKLDPIETFEMMSKIADWNKWKSFFSLGVRSMK
jgi:hypothetical protein